MDVLMLSRVQFGDTAAFHILFPVMSIGFALFMFIMECLWLYTGREEYYRQVRFWMKIFVLTFAVGVASGLPLSLEFGMNWAAFSASAGSFFGNLLGFETTVAFTLETAFLGILIFGWNRVPKGVHLASNFLVLFGASLSAFWIVAANSWMQVPLGIHLNEFGKVIVDDYAAAIFNPATIISYVHMWFACIESSMFLIAGISAWKLLQATSDTVTSFFTRSFVTALAVVLIAAPLQVVVGDLMGLMVAQYQPEKLAALELHWDSNLPGVGAPFNILAVPNASNDGNSFALSIPSALSLLITHSSTGVVPGLNSFAPGDRPTSIESLLVFYSFRIMVLIGFTMMGLALWGAWYWYKGYLVPEQIIKRTFFLKLWLFAIPLGFIATETGWMVREIGRQPWTLYHIMRTSESLSSNLNSYVLIGGLAGLNVLYALLSIFFLYFVIRIIKKGPDFDSPLPSLQTNL